MFRKTDRVSGEPGQGLRRIAACLVLLLSALPARAEVVVFPGTNWMIDAPTGFTLSTDPVARLHNPAGVLIFMQQFDRGPLDGDDKGLLGQVMGEAPNRIRLDRLDPIKRSSAEGFLTLGKMIDRETTMAVVNLMGANSNVVVTLLVPDKAQDSVDLDATLVALMEVREATEAAGNRLGALPVAVPDLAGMRIATVVMGSSALLTDGPAPDMEASADQRFLLITAFPGEPGDFDAKRDAKPIADRLKGQFPGAKILSSKAENGPNGPQVVVAFTRPHPTGVTVRGAALTRPVGDRLVLLIGQSPDDDKDAIDAFRRVFDAIGPK